MLKSGNFSIDKSKVRQRYNWSLNLIANSLLEAPLGHKLGLLKSVTPRLIAPRRYYNVRCIFFIGICLRNCKLRLQCLHVEENVPEHVIRADSLESVETLVRQLWNRLDAHV